MSLAVMDNIAVFVVAREEEQEEWRFIASKNGEAVMEGTIHGGKNAAARYVKFVRNGVMSRAQKVRRNHQRRKTKEAADADT